MGGVLSRRGMMMAAGPGKIGAFDKAGFQPDHFAVVTVRRVWRAPRPIIPLADEAAPVLDIQLRMVAPGLEDGLLIAVARRSQQVHMVVVAFRQPDRLPLGGDRIWRSRPGR